MKTTLWISAGLLGLALLAAPVTADQVILDDLIVDGSICAGLDCVNGESFGFDTLRLKENNLRIKFQDTSTSASFPTNDWEITANESSNGGQNKFSITDIDGGRIPFTIEAGAPRDSLYVDDGGRIGLGTGTPVVEVHIVDGDTPTVRLEQDGSSGFTPQTWDLAGNETNFFVRDATNGSKLPFRIRPNAPSNSIFVDNDGDVGLGTSSPGQELQVLRTDGSSTFIRVSNTNATAQVAGFTMENNVANYSFNVNTVGDFQATQGGTGIAEFEIDSDAAGNTAKFKFQRQTTGLLMEIQADGDVNSLTGVFGTISDRNAKRDISPVNPREVLAKLDEIPISTWRYKENNDSVHMGPMAQDFYAAFGLHEGDTSIALNDLSGVALAAIQGLSEELEERDLTIEELLARIEALEDRLAEE